jgi:hypothetical protein
MLIHMPTAEPRMKVARALDALRARVMSLTANTNGINPGLRAAHRDGFAQCRCRIRDLIAEQIDLMEKLEE